MDWLLTDFAASLDIDSFVEQDLKFFYYQDVKLEDALSKLKLDIPINYKRALLYDAARMASADGVYSTEEQGAVKLAGEILGVPNFMVSTIEGLVKTEQSLADMRKSIFEVQDIPLNDLFDTSKSKMKLTSPYIRSNYGISRTTDKSQRYYGYCLMLIAGADGQLSDLERDWYFKYYAKLERTLEDVLSSVRDFDYLNSSIEYYVTKLEADVPINFAKMLLYHSVLMSKADRDFAAEEREAMLRVASLLGINHDIADAIEYLIEAEEKLASMRKILFRKS